MREVVVAVLGEACSGKSALVEKYLDPSAQIQPMTGRQDEWNYYEVQEPMLSRTLNHTMPDGEQVQVKFLDIPGSRGRGFNWHGIFQALRSAHVIMSLERVFSRSPWSPLGERIAFQNMIENHKRKIPCLIVGTYADLVSDEERAAALSSITTLSERIDVCRGAYLTSAVTNEGVRETVEAAIVLGLQHRDVVHIDIAVKPTLLHKLAKLFSFRNKSAATAAPTGAITTVGPAATTKAAPQAETIEAADIKAAAAEAVEGVEVGVALRIEEPAAAAA